MKLRNSLFLVLALSLSSSLTAWSADEVSDTGAIDSAVSAAAASSIADDSTGIQVDDGMQRGGGGSGGGNRGGGGGGQRPEPQPVRPEPQPVRPEPVQGPGRPDPQPFRPGPQQPGRPNPGEGAGRRPGQGPGRPDGGRGRTFDPVVLRGGIFQGRHWDHPEFNRPVFAWEWNNVSVVTCTSEDSEGNIYPVTESEFSGIQYEQQLPNIEDASLDMCYDQSNGDTSCVLTGCTPQY